MSATTDGRAGTGPFRAQLSLFEGAPADQEVGAPDPAADPDAAARAHAVDPGQHVVLEASAGTGKTSVLVARYVNLLRAGVDPANILAITFTRKAAAEMRERILRELRGAAERSALDRTLWASLRDRAGEVAISTIDAFCLSLLREFPLEADVDPGFELADETELPRLTATALDRAMRILAGQARTDSDVALVLAQLGIARARQGLAMLLDRRLVAWKALDRFLARGPRDLAAAQVCGAAARRLLETLETVQGGLSGFVADGPAGHPRFELFVREIDRLRRCEGAPDAAIRTALDRITAHFLTAEGRARRAGAIPPYRAEHYPSREAARRHREAVFALAPPVEEVMFAFRRDLNAILARGVRRMFAVALAEYRQALEERSVLDFSDVLQRALELLRRMDEFSQSRYRLESRYHHVLVDEFQDTSRAQWELISLLVQAWGEGLGLAASPSIFIVGDRKQSIYRFRDAEVEVLEEAAGYIEALRPGGGARRAITRSFRAVPVLLHFANDLFTEISDAGGEAGGFTYGDRDRFPVDPAAPSRPEEPPLGLAVAESPEACASAVAVEIERLLAGATVRDVATGLRRPARPGDVAILFRSRSSHREFERELGARRIPTHVYKGLGFFDADEVKDVVALIRFLADPTSNLRAAAFMRSRVLRISDPALALLAPDLARALTAPAPLPDALPAEDRQAILMVREDLGRWLAAADRVLPAELLDAILAESAYAYELRGTRRRQAWENLKKMRGLVRRMQNRGYATLRRIAEYLLSMSAGDESNAAIEAIDAVNLMTVHASKGLEFPIVFVVNLAKGATGPPQPIRVVAGTGDGAGGRPPSVTIGPFISETDEAEREHERQETRRLLYVAVTRARDRLYFASTLRDGQLVPGRGSLAEVLPPSIGPLFGQAMAAREDTVRWQSAAGRAYEWIVCRPGPGPTDAAAPPPAEPGAPAAGEDFAAPAVALGRLRVTATGLSGSGEEDDEDPTGERSSERPLGSLVHRLFQQTPEPADLEAAVGLARRLAGSSREGDGDPDALAARAAAIWLGARGRPDVRAALDGERRYEVPFSLHDESDPPRVVRGTIDCLVRKPGPSFTVVEFKTGRARPAHERQLQLYVRAVRALHPGVPVIGLVLYL